MPLENGIKLNTEFTFYKLFLFRHWEIAFLQTIPMIMICKTMLWILNRIYRAYLICILVVFGALKELEISTWDGEMWRKALKYEWVRLLCWTLSFLLLFSRFCSWFLIDSSQLPNTIRYFTHTWDECSAVSNLSAKSDDEPPNYLPDLWESSAALCIGAYCNIINVFSMFGIRNENKVLSTHKSFSGIRQIN